MTIRSLILGLLLAVSLSALAHFNEALLRQSSLSGNLLPVGVFGTLVLVVLSVNPLLGWLGRWVRGSDSSAGGWGLSRGELAVVSAMGLAVCGFLSAGFLTYFAPMVAMPSQHLKSTTAWQAAGVWSYLPGGSMRLAEGQVRDLGELCRWLAAEAGGADAAAAAGGEEAAAALRESIRRACSIDEWEAIKALAAGGRPGTTTLPGALSGINRWIEQAPAWQVPALRDAAAAAITAGAVEGRGREALRPGTPDLADGVGWSMDDRDAFNRWLLVAMLPDQVMAPPAGRGALLDGGRSDPAISGAIIQGWGSASEKGLADIPWSAWWPTLRLWCGTLLLLSLAGLCMMLVVHPQWSGRELLPYPMAQFADAVIDRPDGRLLPLCARDRLFWYGLAAMLLLHLNNGLSAWNSHWPFAIPRVFNFSPLAELFPGIAKVNSTWGLFWPKWFPALIAFSFFLTTQVSLSLGVSMIAWGLFGATLMAYGVPMSGTTDNFSLQTSLMFGAFVGVALVVLYTGRRHYLDVARAAIGWSRPEARTPMYCVWAARGMSLAVVLAVLLLRTGGLDWVIGLCLVGTILLAWLVAARVNAESGLIVVQTLWMPTWILSALLGYEAIGPTAMIVMTLGGFMLLADAREAVSAQLGNALRLADTPGAAGPGRTAGAVAVAMVLGLAVAVVVSLTLQYQNGLILTSGSWARDTTAKRAFSHAASLSADLSSRGELQRSTRARGVEKLALLRPSRPTLLWVGIGAAMVIGCTAARLRLPWWPIHPVIFLLWGTWTGAMMWLSFLIGWAIKASVVKVGGLNAYRATRPLMIGIIAGELLAAVMWMIAAAIAYALTGKAPPSYSVFPF